MQSILVWLLSTSEGKFKLTEKFWEREVKRKASKGRRLAIIIFFIKFYLISEKWKI